MSLSSNRKKILSGKKIAISLSVIFVLLSIAIYLILSENLLYETYDFRLVMGLLGFNIIIIIALISIILFKSLKVWKSRKLRQRGMRMQRRIVFTFSLLAIIPSVLMAGFSIFFFVYGMQSWFDSKISKALDNSVSVADAYIKEHAVNLKADAYAMSKDISRHAIQLMQSENDFKNFLSAQSAWRTLTDAIVFRKKDILASSKDTVQFLLNIDDITDQQFAEADNNDIVLIMDEKDKVKALIRLKNFRDTYLLISRMIDPKVLNYAKQTKDSVNEYSLLKENALTIQYQFILAFAGLSIILVLSAIWVGLVFSGKIVAPVHKLISATERVKSGDLTVRLDEGKKDDEVTTLFKAFNRMTANLQMGQKQLVQVNKQIDERRRLIEAVFAGVTSGVISLDENKRIELYNKSAVEILRLNKDELMRRYIADIFPEITTYFAKLKDFPGRIYQQEIDIKRGGAVYNLLIRIIPEKFLNQVEGYIITIDNITDLVNAQRTAAWSDVARRIAHEIKNPLTPITLSAERIRSKYNAQVDNPENFNRYIDTIIKHSENIEKIVKEFSQFARMPRAILRKNNFTEMVNDVIFSEKVVNKDIEYIADLPELEIYFDFDKEQLGQVMLNLLKNAAENIKEHKSEQENNFIKISAEISDFIEVEISDSGTGFPVELMNRLTEPYVTTREKGTGLGLAIVKKILDDHGASLELGNKKNEEGEVTGASIKISFPTG